VKTVCVQPCDIEMAKELCKGSETEVICVLDFPQGQATPEAKEMLAELYAKQGVAEIDMVLNYGYLRSGAVDKIEDEVSRVVGKAHSYNVPVKVIFETSELDEATIRKAVEVSIEAGADFVKTSTGFTSTGATVEGVAAMVDQAKGRIKVKASGGIRDYAGAKKFVDMGVERLGIGYSGSLPVCTGEGENKDAY
jgi:deoxyribose-phosphate aldolase